jgi:glycosyltransferase involved in cell wall biosynthesis
MLTKPLRQIGNRGEFNMMKELNFLAGLGGQGGGEQSACKIVELLRLNGWKVNFIPWSGKHSNYSKIDTESFSFPKMAESMRTGIPLIFYCNDNIPRFCGDLQTPKIIENSNCVVFCINYTVNELPYCAWLSDTKKVKAVIFQNEEKKLDFLKKSANKFFIDSSLVLLYGAINLDAFLISPLTRRSPEQPLVVVRHSTPDNRKYVTTENIERGAKIHPWQKHLKKEDDISFYKAIADSVPSISFRFMEANRILHDYFERDARFKFYKWNQIPVTEFLSSAHVFLYRVSDDWRDQYPRCMGEALAAGLPCIGEPRDGPMDRITYGQTGFYGITTSDYISHIKLLYNNENLRQEMSKAARNFATKQLDPRRWVTELEKVILC